MNDALPGHSHLLWDQEKCPVELEKHTGGTDIYHRNSLSDISRP